MIDRQRCLLFTNVYLFSVYVQFLAGEKDTCQWNKQNVWLQNWLYIKNNVINIKELNKIILKIRTFWIIKQKGSCFFLQKKLTARAQHSGTLLPDLKIDCAKSQRGEFLNFKKVKSKCSYIHIIRNHVIILAYLCSVRRNTSNL